MFLSHLVSLSANGWAKRLPERRISAIQAHRYSNEQPARCLAVRTLRQAVAISLTMLVVLVTGTLTLNAQEQTAPRVLRASPVLAPPKTAAPASDSSALAQRLQTAGSAHVEKRVLALYYPWYQTLQYSHKWAHQDGVEMANKRMVSHTHFPSQGPYDSQDPALIDRHISQAEEAGIDTLVCSWWGPRDPTDHALRLLLMRAAKTKIKICVLWERLSAQSMPQTPETDLTYLVDTFGKQPAYLKVEGKAVIFALEPVCRSLRPEAWAELLNRFNKRSGQGVALMGSGREASDLLVWDGLYTLGLVATLGGRLAEQAAAEQGQESAARILLGRRLNRITVVGLSPGYDDRKPNATQGIAGRTLVERQEGRLYSALWRQAMADNPDWILINSFNQWHAGSEIEPSVELGDTYLKLTRQYVMQFKKGKD